MSRISPAVAAAAHAYIVKPGGACSVCGRPVERGGMWMGEPGPVYLCTDRRCVQKLLLLALDALADSPRADDERSRYTAWLRLADETFDRWADAEARKVAR